MQRLHAIRPDVDCSFAYEAGVVSRACLVHKEEVLVRWKH